MKISIKVTELTHDEIVTILADVHEITLAFRVALNHYDYPDLPKIHTCLEDMAADMLLSGKSIFIYDTHSRYKKFGKLPAVYDEQMECMKYTVTLQDFLNGCSKAYELTSKLLKGEGDCIDAYNILQMIVFGEEIYR